MRLDGASFLFGCTQAFWIGYNRFSTHVTWRLRFPFLFLYLYMRVVEKDRPAQTLHSYTHFLFVIPVIHHTILSILCSFPRVSYSPNAYMHLWSGFDLPMFSLWWYLRNCLVYACFSPRSHYIDVALQGWFLEQAVYLVIFFPILSYYTVIHCLSSAMSCFMLYTYVFCTCIHVCMYF